MAHAAPLLERYRNTHLVFNDDIQGTATCAVGGVYGAMAVLGTPSAHLSHAPRPVVRDGCACRTASRGWSCWFLWQSVLRLC